ncbi:MAG: hypothetical protein RLZZ385_2451 [Pseudomonadota bacterium]|jgi:protein-tyrosine phosphatase
MSELPGQPVIRVLMVCLGNICRSPTAHGVFQQRVIHHGLQERIQVDSAGTANYHIGEAPDGRSVQAARMRGYDLQDLRARQVQQQDFHRFHYILAMDHGNLRELMLRCPPEHRGKLQLFLSYGRHSRDAVPDPYYSGPEGFELVLDLVEGAADGLLHHILQTHFPQLSRGPV